MVDIFRTALRLHQRTLNRVAGGWAVYQDGAVKIRLEVTPANSQSSEARGEGEVEIGTNTNDFLCESADMVHKGEQVEPRPGATITLEDTGHVYELCKGPRGAAFRYTDAREVRMRIHTDKIDP